jgi:hypothetical protein
MPDLESPKDASRYKYEKLPSSVQILDRRGVAFSPLGFALSPSFHSLDDYLKRDPFEPRAGSFFANRDLSQQAKELSESDLARQAGIHDIAPQRQTDMGEWEKDPSAWEAYMKWLKGG